MYWENLVDTSYLKVLCFQAFANYGENLKSRFRIDGEGEDSRENSGKVLNIAEKFAAVRLHPCTAKTNKCITFVNLC